VLLATRWCQDPDSPPWARYKTPTTWAALLALPAAHGWTVRDLHRLLEDHTTSGRRLLTHPHNPIAYLSWLLNQVDLADRPCALDDVYAAYEAELAAKRQAAVPAQLAAAAHARRVGRAALQGDGHRQVREVLAQRAGDMRNRKVEPEPSQECRGSGGLGSAAAHQQLDLGYI